MSWLSSFGVAVISGFSGLFLAGFIANACVSWYRVSTFEGKAGYFVGFIALAGGIVGAIMGLVTARVVAAGVQPGFLRALGIAVGVNLGTAAIAMLLCRLGADIAPTLHGKELELEVEVRCPKGFNLPTPDEYGATAGVHLPGGRRLPTAPLRVDEARTTDGQLVVPATVFLTTRSANKFLQIRLNAEHKLLFNLPLRPRPRDEDREWSPWVESGWDASRPEPAQHAKFSARYRVRTIEPPPPEPTQAEENARERSEEQEKFDAVKSDAPISDWLPYTAYGAEEERRAVAIRNITAKPHYVAELSALMVADDAETAREALSLVVHLPDPPTELIPALEAAGKHLIGLIRTFNGTPVEQDPGYHGAADISIRFSAWHDAVTTLREKRGGDFIPELREMLELSRVRTDSHVMQQDVRRVASYYAKVWGGIEPLPSDPPPR